MPQNPPIIAGTRIGHVHLKVADLDRALGFYCGVLGFEVMQRMGDSAAFISARRLSPSHRAQHLGKQRRPSAAAGHHRAVSHRHSLSHPPGAGGCAVSRDPGRHRARRRQRSRRQRGAVSARSRPERRRAVSRPAEGRMAARAGWVARDVHETAGSGGFAAGAGNLIPHGEEARSAVSNHESPDAAILRDAASRLLRMRTSRARES